MTEKGRFLLFAVGSCLAGVLFFRSLDSLWPLAEVDLHRPRAELAQQAGEFLAGRNVDLTAYQSTARLRVEAPILDYLEPLLGMEATQALITRPLPLVYYEVYFKRADTPKMYALDIHPAGVVLGWRETRLELEPGTRLEPEAARRLADETRELLPDGETDWELKGSYHHDYPERRDYRYTFERFVLTEPELRERLFITISGDRVGGIHREMVTPEGARFDARRREAAEWPWQIAGYVLLVLAGFAAIAAFLHGLHQGYDGLKRTIGLALFAFSCGTVAQFLQSADFFLEWDPLWPRWIATLQSMLFGAAQNVQILLLLLVVIAAGDFLDRRSGGGRGASLWLAAKGRWLDSRVGWASLNGFLLGLICGGMMTVAVLILLKLTGGHVSIQPRGFFFYALNATWPPLATLLFFLGIAMIEELGYRYCCGTMLFSFTKKRWLAILVPGVIYGLTHTQLGFLPPADPVWARPLVLTLVGCVWGWGFFRFDALTVVISHLTADLFIFNWPRLASGDPSLVTSAVITIAVPLIPALGLLHRRSANVENLTPESS